MPSCQSFSRGGFLVSLLLFVSLFLFAATEWSHAAAAREAGPSTPAPSDEKQAARAKLIQLRQEIAYHDDLYYNKGAPIISDQAYDALKRELQDLERTHPELAASAAATTPLRGESDGRFPAHRHLAPMLSLEKAYSETELEAFHQRIQKSLGSSTAAYRIEPKIDGIAISVTYRDGQLTRAATRGNGQTGDDITSNLVALKLAPSTLSPSPGHPVPELIELRGELFVSKSDFKAYNAEREAAGEAPFAHPRALAAGSARLDHPQEAANRPLSIAFFGYEAYQPDQDAPATLTEFHQRAQAWGLPMLRETRFAEGLDSLVESVSAMRDERAQYPYLTDGVVIKADSTRLQRQLGNGLGAPRWAIAYKFAAPRAETRLLDITLQVGRTGLVTPVAELAPITLGGSRIARASLHNAQTIARLDLRLGDTVYLEMAGEIIPQVVGVNRLKRPANAPPFAYPERCPSCETPLQVENGKADHSCRNPSCPAQLLARLAYFASRDGVDISGLGPATLQALVASGRLRRIADLYQIELDDILQLDGYGNVSARKLLDSIESSKRAPLWRFINGLGIPGIGPARSRTLAQGFGSLEALAVFAGDETTEEVPLPGFGPATVESLRRYFSQDPHRAQLEALFAHGVRPAPPKGPTPNDPASLAGKIFVFTGSLPSLTRAEATALVESAGGEARSTVSARTDYLVVGENPGQKRLRARQLDIPELNESELRRLLRP